MNTVNKNIQILVTKYKLMNIITCEIIEYYVINSNRK